MQERYSHILEQWFIMEPPLFQVLCIHELVPNTRMKCPLRSGRKKLEYNPDIVVEMSDDALEEALRAEAVRLLLKHPYERRPDGCSQQAMGLASNLVVGDNYSHPRFRIETPADLGLKSGMNYEWYAKEVEKQLAGAGDGESDGDSGGVSTAGERHRDLAELWEEDELTVQMINGVISSTKNWGSISGNFAEILTSSLKAKINWRNVFAGFRASIISSKRKLTRMRPNRRTGFAAMGSVRKFNTRLLIAVDVSGSVSDKSLSDFFGVVNSAFRYGFESVDVLQFDDGIHSVTSVSKVVKNVKVHGRGGTSFQEPVDYAHEHGYEGLVILTDGCARKPEMPSGMRTRILWACVDRKAYDENKDWMLKTGRVCVIQI